MQIMLDPKSGYIKENKKFDKRNALIDVGVKAAVCYKEGSVTPEMIRASETDEELLKRGVKTILDSHTSPSEQQAVALEIIGLPKALCMFLNNEHLYAADERSLRYTLVEPSEYISETEVNLYNKWLEIFINILTTKYFDFFANFNKRASEEATKRAAKSAIKKIAQENARYMVSVFTPTTLTYTVPLAQINKICLYMQNIIKAPASAFEELMVPYFNEFISILKELDVLVLNEDVYKYAPTLLTKYQVENNKEILYKNDKHINLTLLAIHNKFSGINKNQFGSQIAYNMNISLASLAQWQRHRSMNFEMVAPHVKKTKFYVPLILQDNKALVNDWLADMNTVNKYYPQGKIVRVCMSGPLTNLVDLVGKERACDRAFLETQDMFTNQVLPEIYQGLLDSEQYNLAENLSPYVGKLRCMYPDYNCPGKCGHPRVRRLF